MPRGDGTGPGGMGPMTGRAAGYCAGYGMPGFANPAAGRGRYGYGLGFRRGYGGGWGARTGYAAPNRAPVYPAAPAYAPAVRPEDEQRMIEDDIKYLKEDLKAMEERLAELKKEQKK